MSSHAVGRGGHISSPSGTPCSDGLAGHTPAPRAGSILQVQGGECQFRRVPAPETGNFCHSPSRLTTEHLRGVGGNATGPQLPTTIYFRLTPQVARKRSNSLASCPLYASNKKACTAAEKKLEPLLTLDTAKRNEEWKKILSRFDEVSLHRRACRCK